MCLTIYTSLFSRLHILFQRHTVFRNQIIFFFNFIASQGGEEAEQSMNITIRVSTCPVEYHLRHWSTLIINCYSTMFITTMTLLRPQQYKFHIIIYRRKLWHTNFFMLFDEFRKLTPHQHHHESKQPARCTSSNLSQWYWLSKAFIHWKLSPIFRKSNHKIIVHCMIMPCLGINHHKLLRPSVIFQFPTRASTFLFT